MNDFVTPEGETRWREEEGPAVMKNGRWFGESTTLRDWRCAPIPVSISTFLLRHPRPANRSLEAPSNAISPTGSKSMRNFTGSVSSDMH